MTKLELRSSAIRTVLVAIGLASCTLTASLDDLKGDPVSSGSTCQKNVDCSGCGTCSSKCACLLASDFDSCVAACPGAGGTGGVGGGSGSGGGGGGGAGGASGGGASGGSGGNLGGSANTGEPGFVWCGSDKCDLQTHVCCYESIGPALWPKCIPSVDTCTGVRVECDGTQDCSAAQVCCAALSGGTYSQLSCSDSCDANSEKVCGSTPIDCAGTLCEASVILPEYFVCHK